MQEEYLKGEVVKSRHRQQNNLQFSNLQSRINYQLRAEALLPQNKKHQMSGVFCLKLRG